MNEPRPSPRMTAVTGCPSSDGLASFLEGVAAADVHGAVEAHLLAGCADCREVAQHLGWQERPVGATSGNGPSGRWQWWSVLLMSAALLIGGVWLWQSTGADPVADARAAYAAGEPQLAASLLAQWVDTGDAALQAERRDVALSLSVAAPDVSAVGPSTDLVVRGPEKARLLRFPIGSLTSCPERFEVLDGVDDVLLEVLRLHVAGLRPCFEVAIPAGEKSARFPADQPLLQPGQYFVRVVGEQSSDLASFRVVEQATASGIQDELQQIRSVVADEALRHGLVGLHLARRGFASEALQELQTARGIAGSDVLASQARAICATLGLPGEVAAR